MWPVHTIYFDRGAGAGLFLLRAVAGAALALYALTGAIPEPPPSSLTALLPGVELIAGGCLLLGFLTPIASVIALSDFAALTYFHGSEAACAHSSPSIIAGCAVVAGVGMALVGPGAYSLDALLFGRREVIVERLPGSRDE